MDAFQASGVCVSCGRDWTATVPLGKIPHVRCICGQRHVVEEVFYFNGVPLVRVPDETHHALPSVN